MKFLSIAIIALQSLFSHTAASSEYGTVTDSESNVDILSSKNAIIPQDRYLKRSKFMKKNKPIPLLTSSIEGIYIYAGCGMKLYQVNIVCGIYGVDDQDLCLYSETSIGQIVEDSSSNEAAILIPGTGSFFVPLSVDEKEKDRCVLAGTFRNSATVVVDDVKKTKITIKAIPLAASTVCEREQFTSVVKGEVIDRDGNLKLFFSKDSGFVFFNDNTKIDGNGGFNAIKLEESDMTNGRKLFDGGAASFPDLIGRQLNSLDRRGDWIDLCMNN